MSLTHRGAAEAQWATWKAVSPGILGRDGRFIDFGPVCTTQIENVNITWSSGVQNMREHLNKNQ